MKMPTKKQIISAVKKCPEAETVLKGLFPDVFKESVTVPFVNGSAKIFPHNHPLRDVIQIRTNGKYRQKGLWICDPGCSELKPKLVAEGDAFVLVLEKVEKKVEK